jgi:hypothetical protein
MPSKENRYFVETFPKLYVKRESRENPVEILAFEQAKDLPFGQQSIVVVEGQLVNSHEEFLMRFSKEQFRNREHLTVLLLPLICGG